MKSEIKKFKNKRVLVTGADGFMGSHLAEKLVKLGAKVSVFIRGNSVNGTSEYNLRNLKNIMNKIEAIITGNIGSSDAKKLILDNKPDYIFHLAATVGVKNVTKNPIYTVQNNEGDNHI